MSVTTDWIFIKALSLPMRERASLINELLASLEPERGSSEIEVARKQEGLDRCVAFDDGKITERDATEVLHDAYRRLK
jgi:Putative addiction module component